MTVGEKKDLINNEKVKKLARSLTLVGCWMLLINEERFKVL